MSEDFDDIPLKAKLLITFVDMSVTPLVVNTIKKV